MSGNEVKKNDVVDLRWLADGQEDPHPRYIELPREDLAGAHLFSDDELANKLSMMSTISDERDTAMMIDTHRNNGDYVCKSMLGEIAKDRLRWLSRRVAVLEGRYPGVTVSPVAPAKVVPLSEAETQDPFNQAVAEARLERQVPLLAALVNLPDGVHTNTVASLLVERKLNIDSLKLCVALGMFMDKRPVQRWQIYVGVARDLLKQGVFIPFWDDEYRVDQAGGTVYIEKSKYFKHGRHRVVKVVEPTNAVTLKTATLW